MMNIKKTILAKWLISYDPYSDFFQFYDKGVLKIGKKELVKKEFSYQINFFLEKKTNKLLMLEIDNAYDALGSNIEVMDKKDIIDTVLNTLNKYGNTTKKAIKY